MTPTRTLPTTDPDAIELNRRCNQVAHRIEAGHYLIQLLKERFDNNIRDFRRWLKANSDASEKSIARFIQLASNAEKIESAKLIRLVDAYSLLNLELNNVELRIPTIH